MPHGGGHHGGGSRVGGFTYLVDNSDWSTQAVDLQPDGNTISVACPSSNPFEDGCDVHVQTQLSGGLAGPDPHQVSRRIVARPRQLPAVHAGRAAVHQYHAAAVRRGFLPGLGAAPAGKPKPKPKATPATQTVLVVTPAAEPSWWESMVGGPVGALQAQALPRAPTVRRVTIPVAKPAAKTPVKAKPKTAAMPAGSSPVSGLGDGPTDLFEADDGSSGSDSSAPVPYGPPSSLAPTTVISAPGPTAIPFSASQYVPPPLAPQSNLGPTAPVAPMSVTQPAAPATSSGPSLFSQISNSITSLTPAVAPVLAAAYKVQAAKAAAKTAQAQATQQSLLQQAAAAATKSSNLPIILVGGGALLLTVVLLMRRS